MKSVIVTLSLATAFAFHLGCTPEDDERCGKGQTYNSETGACQLPPDTATDDTDTSEEPGGSDAGGSDAGGDSSTDEDAMPEGFGSSCTENGSECDDFPEANYCAWDPINQDGFCSIKDCEVGDDLCPENYACCDTLPSYGLPTFCAVEADMGSFPLSSLCAQ